MRFWARGQHRNLARMRAHFSLPRLSNGRHGHHLKLRMRVAHRSGDRHLELDADDGLRVVEGLRVDGLRVGFLVGVLLGDLVVGALVGFLVVGV